MEIKSSGGGWGFGVTPSGVMVVCCIRRNANRVYCRERIIRDASRRMSPESVLIWWKEVAQTAVKRAFYGAEFMAFRVIILIVSAVRIQNVVSSNDTI